MCAHWIDTTRVRSHASAIAANAIWSFKTSGKAPLSCGATGANGLGAAQVVLGMLIFAASLEAFVGLCLGCKIFAIGIRLGWVPEEVCEACNNVGDRIKDLKTAA